MRISIRLLRPFDEAAGRSTVELEMPAGSTVRDLVVNLCERFPPLKGHIYEQGGGITEYLTMFLNDKPVLDIEMPLADGGELLMMFPVSGG